MFCFILAMSVVLVFADNDNSTNYYFVDPGKYKCGKTCQSSGVLIHSPVSGFQCITTEKIGNVFTIYNENIQRTVLTMIEFLDSVSEKIGSTYILNFDKHICVGCYKTGGDGYISLPCPTDSKMLYSTFNLDKFKVFNVYSVQCQNGQDFSKTIADEFNDTTLHIPIGDTLPPILASCEDTYKSNGESKLKLNYVIYLLTIYYSTILLNASLISE